MAIDQEEVDAVAAALGEEVSELLSGHQDALFEMLKAGDNTKLKAVFDVARDVLGELKASEDQKAWNEDVRAFTVALIAATNNAAEEDVQKAMKLADEIQKVRKARTEVK